MILSIRREKNLCERRGQIMEYSGVDHIHIFTQNLENTVNFFSVMLGSRWNGPIEIPQVNIRTAFSDDGIEVVQSTGPDKDGVAVFLERHGVSA